MKLILLSILICLAFYANCIDCDSIKPTKREDCALSLEDKTKYGACCYYEGLASCVAFYQESYDMVKGYYQCNNKSYVAPPPSPKTCDQIKPQKPSDCVFYGTYTHAIYIKDIPKDELPKNVSTYFISNYKNTGIIPSILIAHFLIQSEYTQSELFREANNAFNMKCALVDETWKWSSWNKKFNYTKDGIEYRIYDYFEESIADFSAYLIGSKKENTSIFEGIKNCKDYKKAAKILAEGEFPDDASYQKKLTDLVEQYDLTQYDTFEESVEDESIRHCCFQSFSSYSSSCKALTNYEYAENDYFYSGIISRSFICKTKPRVNNNCNSIIPEKPSDCILSEKDKETYQHCCYFKYKKEQIFCIAYDEDGYTEALEDLSEEVKEGTFVCDVVESSSNKFKALNLLLLFFIILIIYF